MASFSQVDFFYFFCSQLIHLFTDISTLQVVGQFYGITFNPGDADKIKGELHKNLQVFEDELKGKFFAGKI